jgi:hypothetical protein
MMDSFDKIKKVMNRKKKRRNPFERAVFDEGEFVRIRPLINIEPISEEKEDGSADSRSDIPE